MVAVGDFIRAADINPITIGAWNTYTPTLTSSVNPNLGSGPTQYGHYMTVGKLVIASVYIKFGSSGSSNGTGFYVISLPVTPISTTMGNSQYRIGTGRIQCAALWTFVDVTADGRLHYSQAAAGGAQHDVTETSPGTWTNNDFISLNLHYEAA